MLVPIDGASGASYGDSSARAAPLSDFLRSKTDLIRRYETESLGPGDARGYSRRRGMGMPAQGDDMLDERCEERLTTAAIAWTTAISEFGIAPNLLDQIGAIAVAGLPEAERREVRWQLDLLVGMLEESMAPRTVASALT